MPYHTTVQLLKYANFFYLSQKVVVNQADCCVSDESQRGLRPEGPLKNVLVTGGAGYIATHTIICLLQAGYDVTVVDNLVNSNKEGIQARRFTVTARTFYFYEIIFSAE